MTTQEQYLRALAAGATSIPDVPLTDAEYRALVWQIANGATVGLRATRASATDQYLVDVSDGSTIADSGAPDYDYPGLTVEDHVSEGDTVTDMVLWNAVTAAPVVGATVVGRPASSREFGLDDCSGVDGITYPLPNTFTVAIYFESSNGAFRSIGFLGTGGGSYGGVNTYIHTSTLLINARIGSSVKAGFGLAAPASGRHILIVKYDGGTGRLDARLYTGAGVFLEAGNDTGAVCTFGSQTFGGKSNAIDAYPDDGLTVMQFTGLLSTAAQDAIADGTDETGGGTRIVDAVGIRSGVYDSAAPGVLIGADGAGLPVTAEIA